MKKIFVQMSNPIYDNNSIFICKDLNKTYARYFELKRRFLELGYELTTADDNELNNCEGIIFFDANSLRAPTDLKTKFKNLIKRLLKIKIPQIYPVRDLYQEAINANMGDKIILVIWETRAVCPLNFSSSTFNKFNRILTWDDDLLQNHKFSKFYIPMEDAEIINEPVPFNQKKILINISFNKYSTYKKELYSARRKTTAYFDRHYQNDFDLYGPRWNQPVTRWQLIFPWLVKKYSTYRGHAKFKIKTLSQYKFNLCYENISDARGYIADRIFSSFHAKSVPIYWGAPNIAQYVDPDTFIDRRQFKNDAELAKFLKQMTEKEYNKYLSAASRYMQSEKYAKFQNKNFCDTIIRTLNVKNLNT